MTGDLVVVVAELSVALGPDDRLPGLAFLESKKGAPRTRASYRRCLLKLSRLLGVDVAPEFIPWQHVTWDVAAWLKGQMVDANLAPSSINLHLSALRGVLKACWRMELISAEDYHRARSIEGVATTGADEGGALLVGRFLSAAEVATLLAACRGDRPIDRRDAALVAVLVGCGLRRAEAAGLSWSDVRPPLLVLVGKGAKRREVAIPVGTQAALQAWSAVAGDDDGRPVFLRCPKGGKIGGRLSAKGVRLAVGRRAESAGLGKVTAHDLRRTFITRRLAAGVDPLTVARAAGHGSLDTTRRYDGRLRQAEVDAARLVVIPYS